MTPPPYAALVGDLADEHDALDEVVRNLAEREWDTATPAEGWAVRHQIGHLAWFDEAATRAANDPDGFAAEVAGAADDVEGYMGAATARADSVAPAELLAWWRSARASVLAAFADLDPKARLPWYGPPMSAMSFATARLMETWAHGQDVVDAVGAERAATDRIRHIADLGVRTRRFSYLVRGLEPPEVEVRVELSAPSGAAWTWGPEDAADRVAGPALDLCLVVTQRRHPADTALVAQGPAATGWLAVAQAFAGGPGPGRPPTTT